MATTVNTLETDTEVFKGDRVVADGVERELGDVTIGEVAGGLVSNIDPFGDSSLLAKYELDGNALDTTGNYNGTATSITYGTGKFGQGIVSTSAAQNNVRIPIGSTLNLNANKTISFFVKVTTLGTYMYAYSQGTIASNQINQTIVMGYADGFIQTRLYNGAYYQIISDVTTVANTWYHIALTYEAGVQKLYIDSVLKGTLAQSNGSSTLDHYICSNVSDSTQQLNGIIDQFEVYSRTLTPTEVSTLYTQSTTKYSADFNTPLASIPASVYRLNHDNLTIDGTPTATTATVSDSRTGLIASGDTVLLDGVGVVCNPVVETDVSVDTTNSLTVGTATAIATYKLDGNATDLSGNYNGTATDVIYGTGKFGQGAVFDGTDKYITTGVSITNIAYTISYFVKPTLLQVNADSNHLGFRSGGASWNQFYAPNTDGSSCNFTVSGNIKISFTGLSTSTYNHILVSVDVSGNAIGYLDGVEVGTATGCTITASNELYIGKYYGSSNSTTATIDQVRIFNKALTPTEVTALYNEQKTEYQYDLTYPTTTAPTRIVLSGNDILPTVASDTFDGTDTFTRTYNTVTKTARDVEYGFVADDNVEIVQVNINQNMEP